MRSEEGMWSCLSLLRGGNMFELTYAASGASTRLSERETRVIFGLDHSAVVGPWNFCEVWIHDGDVASALGLGNQQRKVGFKTLIDF